MSLTYTWKITGIKTDTRGVFEGVVVHTYWQKIGKDESGNEGVFEGVTPFEPKLDPSNKKDFIPADKLDESTVLSWIKNSVAGDYEKHIDERIQSQIDHKKSTISEMHLPWEKK